MNQIEFKEAGMIGKTVKYSAQKDVVAVGVIKDKIDKKEKVDDDFTVTGYLIENEESKDLVPISYWRILSIIDTKDLEKSPKHRIPGGYKNDIYKF